MQRNPRLARDSSKHPNESADYTCSTCGFNLWVPIIRLNRSTLGLYNDARFPGRSILVTHHHYPMIEDVPGDVLSEYFVDLKIASRALRRATDCDRVNIAFLGNAVQHAHAHLFPRSNSDALRRHKSPWDVPRGAEEVLGDTEVRALVRRIENAARSIRMAGIEDALSAQTPAGGSLF